MAQENQGNSNGQSNAQNKKERFRGVYGLWILFAFILFFTLFLVRMLLMAIVGDLPYSGYVINIILSIIFLIVCSWSAYISWSQIPQAHVWLIELFGKYITTWEAGLKFPFPYLNFITINEVYKGEQLMELYMNDKEKDEYGYGDVEFTDISAPVEATLYFKIVDPFKAVYNVENLFRAIEDKMDSATRSYLGQYSIDQANKIKARTSLPHIMDGEYLDPDSKELPRSLSAKEREEKLKESHLYNEMLNDWGVRITGLAISDIVLDEDQKELRRKILEASKKQEAATYEKQATITKAEGEQERLNLEGSGIANQIKELGDQGLAPNEASSYLAERLKWQNVGEKGATVIETSGKRSTVGMGAGFGLGYNASQKDGNKKGQDDTDTGADKIKRNDMGGDNK